MYTRCIFKIFQLVWTTQIMLQFFFQILVLVSMYMIFQIFVAVAMVTRNLQEAKKISRSTFLRDKQKKLFIFYPKTYMSPMNIPG